jgi:general secretion pathway protein G
MVKFNNRHGFSLLELLVTVTIIAVLTSIGVVSYSTVNKRSRDVKRKSDIEQLRSALEMYRSDQGQYPVDISSLVPAYIPVIPTQPNSTVDPYFYLATQNGTVYNVYCIGATLETITSGQITTCVPGTLPTVYNYGSKNP